jgi:capsular polysaccharide biosynthesis protein
MSQEPQLDRHRELALIRTRLPVIIIVTLLAVLAAFGFSSVQSKVYEARASLIVGTSINQANPDLNGLLASQQLAATYATIA